MSVVKSTILGFPRIGKHRELKKALEAFWKAQISYDQFKAEAAHVRLQNWKLQKEKGLSVLTVNDFSYYDHVLDLSVALNAIPERYNALREDPVRLYFAMARGEKGDSNSVTAMEMSKWYDTNYHYIIPELSQNTTFTLASSLKVIDEIKEAQAAFPDTEIRPVLLGPVSYLLLSKSVDHSSTLDCLPALLESYGELLVKIQETGVQYVQIDEPHLVTKLSEREKTAVLFAYEYITDKVSSLKIFLASYFDKLYDNVELVSKLPVDTVHVDLVRGDETSIAPILKSGKNISLGIIDGRNIWKADLTALLQKTKHIIKSTQTDVYISTSCSLLHCPIDIMEEKTLNEEIKSWLSFATQKIEELVLLVKILNGDAQSDALQDNMRAIQSRLHSPRVHKKEVQTRLRQITSEMAKRKSAFNVRQPLQQNRFNFPLFPTTTIGSFPQTQDIRKTRAAYKRKQISESEYKTAMKAEIQRVVAFQEEIGIDVLVHGEPERNDMVEYFGENFDGFVSTYNGWIQSYGSRCVKPPIIYGDLTRNTSITVEWSTYAQSLTTRPVKGMLTGPVTILQWSFVRDDQARKDTSMQIALLIRDEVQDLERAGIGVIQVDEPALREGLPLQKKDREEYLRWAVNVFKVATCGVKDETQIHTHMCYAEFNDILEAIVELDADVISMEASRSRMELLEQFKHFNYPYYIGPGVYDIHSPRVPSVDEIEKLLQYAAQHVAVAHIWINPDCGLKTRQWDEVRASLLNMVQAAHNLRRIHGST